MPSALDLILGSAKKDVSLNRRRAFVDDQGFAQSGVTVKGGTPKVIDLNLPVDAWTFLHWQDLFKKMYSVIFNDPFPYNERKGFNVVFRTIFDTAREEYKLTNGELESFIRWLPHGYLVHVKKSDYEFNMKNVKYKIATFYQHSIEPVREKEERYNRNLRGIIIDTEYLKDSIAENVEDNFDHLIRQMGIPIMLFYCITYMSHSPDDAFSFVYAKLKSRLRFEFKYMKEESTYLEDTVKNSIHWGPYGFGRVLDSLELKDWRDALSWYVDHLRLHREPWWLDGYPEREQNSHVFKLFSKRLAKMK